MKRDKIKFNVYLVGTGEGVYREDYSKDYLGTTYAVSGKQAISQIRYRNKLGTEWTMGDYAGEGSVWFHYVAEEARS